MKSDYAKMFGVFTSPLQDPRRFFEVNNKIRSNDEIRTHMARSLTYLYSMALRDMTRGAAKMVVERVAAQQEAEKRHG